MNDCLSRCAIEPSFEDWVQVAIDPELPPVASRANKLELSHGDSCVVETSDGRFLGRVTVFCPPVFKRPRRTNARVLRRASSEDERRHHANARLEKDIEVHVRRRTKELGLELRPLKVRVPPSLRKIRSRPGTIWTRVVRGISNRVFGGTKSKPGRRILISARGAWGRARFGA